MNQLNVIFPFRFHDMWVFDDERVGLNKEPFVSGADDIIDAMVQRHDIPDAHEGFRLMFSAWEFPGFNLVLEWQRGEAGGNVYLAREVGLEGWLCPALLRYFEEPPRRIYAKFG